VRLKLGFGGAIPSSGRKVENEPLLGDEGIFCAFFNACPPNFAAFDGFRTQALLCFEKLKYVCDCVGATTKFHNYLVVFI
jgi:hypothetical protein